MFNLSLRRQRWRDFMLLTQSSWRRNLKVIRKFVRGTFFQSIVSIFIFISCVVLYRKYHADYNRVVRLSGTEGNSLVQHRKRIFPNTKRHVGVPSSSNKLSKDLKLKTFKCPLSSSHISNRPQIQLDPNKYLLPILTNGPNNQVIGLRDSILLSIALNRTLILPVFFQHRPGAKDDFFPIPPNIRLDPEDLSSLISTRQVADLEETCHGKMNVIFLTKRSGHFLDVGYNANKYEPLTGPINADDVTNAMGNIDLPMIPRRIRDMPMAIPGTEFDDIRAVYKSRARCAVYALPFRNIEVKENAKAIERAAWLLGNASGSALNVNKLNAEVIYSLGYLATHRPRFISAIGESFRRVKLGGGNYIAVHWRYDPSDWMLRCDNTNIDGKEQTIDLCNKLHKIRPRDIAEGIVMYRDALAERSNTFIENVYFSAPLNLFDLVQKVKGQLNQKMAQSRIRLFTFTDMQLHLRRFASCAVIDDYWDEVVSLVEMDICFRSTAFLGSDASSWSMNIKRNRQYFPNEVKDTKFDVYIGDVSWEARQARMRSN